MAKKVGERMTIRARCGWAAAFLFLGLTAPHPAWGQTTARDARAVVDHAWELMGGEALDGVERVRLDMLTQWQRTSFRKVPWTDRPSMESHVDVRDYTIPAWRNTREFGTRSLINVIRDSVAISGVGEEFRPLSVAYVDERDELFTYTPDRLILLLRAAADLRAAGDTVIGSEPHRLVRATLRGTLPVTVAFQRGTGLPTMLRFRHGHPNDFGLVPYGNMWVEVWYSNWRSFGEIGIPTQWDVVRVGVPYKRMTVRAADFNPTFAADSFAVAADLRQAFIDTRGPMHDLSVDSATVVAPGLLHVDRFGFPTGAVRLGDDWVLLEAGHTPLNLDRAIEALRRRGVDHLGAAVAVAARAGNGGVLALVERGVPVYTSAAAKPFLDVMMANAGRAPSGVTAVREGRWLELGGARLRLEPVDLPDTPGSLMVYAPDQRWVYAPDAMTSLDVRMVLERAAALGWDVAAVGSFRMFWSEVSR